MLSSCLDLLHADFYLILSFPFHLCSAVQSGWGEEGQRVQSVQAVTTGQTSLPGFPQSFCFANLLETCKT